MIRRRWHQELVRRLSDAEEEDETMNTDTPDTQLLAALHADDGSTLRRLQARLADAAARDGLLDVAYRTVDTPRRAAAAGRDRPRPGAGGVRRARATTPC